jgi:hypothetical protein
MLYRPDSKTMIASDDRAAIRGVRVEEDMLFRGQALAVQGTTACGRTCNVSNNIWLCTQQLKSKK